MALFDIDLDGAMDICALVRKSQSPGHSNAIGEPGKVVEDRLIPFIHSGSRHFVRRDDLAEDVSENVLEIEEPLDRRILPAATFGK